MRVLPKKLGQGMDAKVYEVVSNSPSDKFIIKKISKTSMSKYLPSFLNVSHEYLENYKFFYEVDNSVFICAEKLDQILDPSADQFRTDILKIINNVLNGLEFMHNTLKLFHCDIKENNIMYSSSGVYKIIDFNNCLSVSDCGNFIIGVIPTRKSIQLWENCRDLGPHVDIWALAAVCFNIYFQQEFISKFSKFNMIKNMDVLSPSVLKDLKRFTRYEISKLQSSRDPTCSVIGNLFSSRLGYVI